MTHRWGERSLLRVLVSVGLSLLLWLGSGSATLAQAMGSQPNADPVKAMTPDDRQTLERLGNRAVAATQRGDFAQAEQYWTDFLEQFPNNPAAWSNRGNVRVSQNKLELALEDYDRAIALAPNAPDPYLNKGAALEALGRWEAAIVNYNQVLTLDPQDAAAYNNRGNAKAGLEDWQAALADYRKATELAPNYPLAWTNAALVQYQLGETAAATRSLRNLVRKYPQFVDARAALTAALWVQGNQGEAESQWVSVTGLDRRYQNLQWVMEIRRWPPAIVAALQQFLSLNAAS